MKPAGKERNPYESRRLRTKISKTCHWVVRVCPMSDETQGKTPNFITETVSRYDGSIKLTRHAKMYDLTQGSVGH